MKKQRNILKALGLAVLLSAAACNPEKFAGDLGPTPTSDEVKITATPDGTNPNIIHFTNETPGTVTAVWDLGNGENGNGKTIDGSYANAGSYDVKLTVFTKGGYASNTTKVTIATTNVSMLDREDYNFLTGGKDSLTGKKWRIAGELKGHLGVGPAAEASPIWYEAGPNEKASEGIYDDRMVFSLFDNFSFNYINHGNTFASGEFAGDLSPGAGGNGDVTVPFTPPSGMSWSISEEGGKKYLKMSKGGFLGYYVGSTRYEILKLTEDEMYLKGDSKKPSDAWWFRLVKESYKQVVVVVTKPYKAPDISDDFDAHSTVVWKKESLTLNESYDNPLPLGLNTSAKVGMYAKQDGQPYEFANMYADFDYKFDLNAKHTVTLKIYIPSSNDFTTELGESWANQFLLKQVSVKLQDGTIAAPFSTQVEKIQQVTQLDRWVQLTFDFNDAVTRKDLDRFVIQVGGEGNFIPGLFYIDDIKFQ